MYEKKKKNLASSQPNLARFELASIPRAFKLTALTNCIILTVSIHIKP